MIYKEISINSLNVDYRENDDGEVFMGHESDDFSVFNMLNEKGGFNLSFGGFRGSYGEFDGENLVAAFISSTLVGEAENKKEYFYGVEFKPNFGDLMYWPEGTEGFENNGYLDLMLTDMKKDKFWRFFDLQLELKDGRISSSSAYVRCIKD